jgi:hypothetical protein
VRPRNRPHRGDVVSATTGALKIGAARMMNRGTFTPESLPANKVRQL